MRPMTVGELLDAALVLLRTRAALLLSLGFGLAAAEQGVLYLLRSAARTGMSYVPREGYVWEWVLLLAGGFGGEAFIIAVLGGVAATAAIPALVGVPVQRLRRSRAATFTAIGVAALIAGLVCGVAVTLFGLPWFFAYALLGLATPAVVIDRKGPGAGLWRSVRLVTRSGLRPGAIRLLGYFGWLFFRFALAAGVAAAIDLVPAEVNAWKDAIPAITFLLVNTLAYPVLGCLDAVLHVEARMRVEGLDIALGRAVRRGEPLEHTLVSP